MSDGLTEREQIRAAVFARAAGRCECCRVREPTEWHHLEQGGARRSMESVGNSCALCWQCHRAYHAGDLAVMAQLLDSLTVYSPGTQEGQRTLLRRIEKARMVRAQTAGGSRGTEGER